MAAHECQILMQQLIQLNQSVCTCLCVSVCTYACGMYTSKKASACDTDPEGLHTVSLHFKYF